MDQKELLITFPHQPSWFSSLLNLYPLFYHPHSYSLSQKFVKIVIIILDLILMIRTFSLFHDDCAHLSNNWRKRWSIKNKRKWKINHRKRLFLCRLSILFFLKNQVDSFPGFKFSIYFLTGISIMAIMLEVCIEL